MMRTMPVLDMFCHGCDTGRPVTVATEGEALMCLRCDQPIRCGQCARPATVDHVLDGHPEGIDTQLVVSRFRCETAGLMRALSNVLPSSIVRDSLWFACDDTEPHGLHIGSVSLHHGNQVTYRPARCPGYEAIDTRQVERALRRGGVPPTTRGLRHWGPVRDGLIVFQEGWNTRVEFGYPDQTARQLTTMLLVARVLAGAGLRTFRETKVQPGLVERLRVGRSQQF